MQQRSSFEREVAALGLREYEGGPADPPAQTVVVGEQVVLDLNKTKFTGKVDTVLWSFSGGGKAVRSYSGTCTSGDVYELDLKNPKLTFYWVDAGDKRRVSASITTKSGSKDSFVAVFDVKGPRLEYFKPTSNLTRIGPDDRDKKMLVIQLGNALPREKAGVRFEWALTMPSQRDGYVKDVQTVCGDRERTVWLKRGGDTRRMVRRHPKNPTLHEQLDGFWSRDEPGKGLICHPGYTSEMETFRHEKGKSTGRMEGSDSPASDLPALLKSIKINQRFFYYVMFKPDTPNAIWVPVAKARWTWKVVATRGSAGWGFAPRDKMKPEMFSSTTDFPLYKSNAAENVWVDPPQKGAGEDSCKTE